MILSEKLKALRIKQSLSQKEFANQIGVSQSSINYWENGQRIPSIEAVAKIADYFHVTIDSLLDDTNTIKKQNLYDMMSGSYLNANDKVADLHFTTNDYTIDEINQILQYALFLKTQRNNEP